MISAKKYNEGLTKAFIPAKSDNSIENGLILLEKRLNNAKIELAKIEDDEDKYEYEEDVKNIEKEIKQYKSKYKIPTVVK